MAVGGRNRKVAEAFARNGGKRLSYFPVGRLGENSILHNVIFSC